MAKARTNPMIKIMLIFLAVIIIYIALHSGGKPIQHESDGGFTTTPSSNSHDVGLGDRDTQTETMKALIGKIDSMQGMLAQQQKQIKKLKTDSNSQKQSQLPVQNSSRQAMNSTSTPTPNSAPGEGSLSSVEKRVDGLLGSVARKPPASVRTPDANVPVGFGYDQQGDRPHDGWIRPLDRAKVPARGVGTPDGGSGQVDAKSDGLLKSTASGAPPDTQRSDRPKPLKVPVYTINQNAMLANAIAYTAIVGRVPRNGKVQDAFKFSLITGAENLASNGFELPNIKGAVWRGVAKGDETFACVRGALTSVTFIFDDGTITTINGSEQDPLGEIGDKYGYPCLSGVYVSTGNEYLAQQVMATALQTGATAAANAQTTTTTSSVTNSMSTAVTGNKADYVWHQLLSGGAKDAANFYAQRLQDFYDAVFVPPGASVTVNIEKQIPIDYDPAGRKLNYGNALPTISLRSSMD